MNEPGITLERLQQLVRHLSNFAWVRYWIHFNMPSEDPWEMAISARNEEGKGITVPELSELGFEARESNELGLVYVIPRATESGTPFTRSSSVTVKQRR